MKQIRAVILNPSSLHDPYWGTVFPVKPELASLQSHLERNGVSAEVIDLEIELGRPKSKPEIQSFLRAARNRLNAADYDILGISCYTSLQYLSSVKIAELSRKVSPSAPIVVGGHHPMAVPTDFTYRGSPFDYVVLGEGEQALLDLCLKPARPETPQVLRGTALPLTRETLPAWELYPSRPEKSLVATYLSRGCPFTCKFCMEPNRPFAGWRSLSVDDAILDVKKIIKIFNPKQIKFGDAIFGFKKSWRRDFLTRLAEIDSPTSYCLETRIDILDSEDLALFARSDLLIALGIESGSEEMLRIMGKAESPRKYLSSCRKIVAEMNALEIPFNIMVMFNHPGETRKTARESIAFFQSLVRAEKTFSGLINAKNFNFYPGNEIEESLKRLTRDYGTVIEHLEWWKEEGDHFVLAAQIDAGPDHLNDSKNTPDFWVADILELLKEINKKMPPTTKLFFAMHGMLLDSMVNPAPTKLWDKMRAPSTAKTMAEVL